MKIIKLAQALVALVIAAFSLTILLDFGNWASLWVWLAVGGTVFLAGSLTFEAVMLIRKS